MSLIVAKTEKEFERCPAGTHLGVCYSIVELGTHLKKFKEEEPKAIKEVAFTWELPNELMADGRPFSISKTYNVSMNDQATMRLHLEAWRGRSFTVEELAGFDMANVLGKGCLLGITHDASKDGKIWTNISTISTLMKGMVTPPAFNKLVLFDLDNFDPEVFINLPEWIKKKIIDSPEYKLLSGQISVAQPEEPLMTADIGTDSDIPF